jgi:hypothetical protein
MAVNPSWLKAFHSSFRCMCYGNVWRHGCTNICDLALTTSLAGHVDHLMGGSEVLSGFACISSPDIKQGGYLQCPIRFCVNLLEVHNSQCKK